MLAKLSGITPVPKPKTIKVSKAKELAWDAFSLYIRFRDSLKTTGTLTHCRCISCGKVVEFAKIQAGHLVDGRTNAVLIDEEAVNGQCVHCNIMLKGNYQAYTMVMIEKYGYEWVQKRLALKNVTLQRKAYEWLEIEATYKQKKALLLSSITS